MSAAPANHVASVGGRHRSARPRMHDDLADFYQREYAQVFGSLCVVLGDTDLAAELTQEAFVRACRDWTRVREMERPGAWVQRVAINLARSWFRRRAAWARVHLRMRPEVELVTGPEDFGLDLWELVQCLSETDREVIALRYYCDASVADTAVLLGIPINTVKSRTHHAITALRKLGLDLENDDEN